MKEKKRHYRIHLPLDEIVRLYTKDIKPCWKIGLKYGVSWSTIQGRLRDAGVELRPPGKYVDHDNLSFAVLCARARRAMRRARIPETCTWCGTEDSGRWRNGRQMSLEVHHQDHDLHNYKLGNLQYLCRPCHMVEIWMWTAWKASKVLLTGLNRSMILEFPKRIKDIDGPVARSPDWKPRERARGARAQDVLWGARRLRICEWCGDRGDMLFVHHRNHSPRDDRLDNLGYLCRTCNTLEGAIWNAWNLDKLLVEELEDGSGYIITTKEVLG